MANECSAFSIIIGIFINSNPYDYLVMVGYIALLAYNLFFLLILLNSLFKGYLEMIRNIFTSEFNSIIQKLTRCPRLRSYLIKKVISNNHNPVRFNLLFAKIESKNYSCKKGNRIMVYSHLVHS